MKLTTHLQPANWIRTSTRNLSLKGLSLSAIIPPNYESYLKVLQPGYEDLSMKDRKTLLHEISENELPPPNKRQLSPIQMKEFARSYNLNYTKEFSFYTLVRHLGSSPVYLIGPHEGDIERSINKVLIEKLTPYTEKECYFYYPTLNSITPGEDLLFKGTLQELEDLIDKNDCSPNYWWPEDRSWMVAMDFDLDFPLIGGPHSLIEELNRTSLESFKIDSTTRIDRMADEDVNP